jgi:hypothetical protein
MGVLILLVGALLACSLSFGSDKPDSATPGSSGGSGGNGIAPVVRVLDPASGAVVPRQLVDLTVETDSTADRFQLNVSGRVAVSKALPPGQSGPTKAILSWMPDHDGTYTLQVMAFNGSVASAPVELVLQVSGTGGTTSSGTTACTGRALVSQLNYRDGPGTAANLLGHFDVGETLTIIGRNNDTSWYKVQRFNAQQAWTINNTQWFQVEGQCDAVPVTQ